MSSTVAARGLEDVIVGPSSLTLIEGERGKLSYRGYDVVDLVRHSTFEETMRAERNLKPNVDFYSASVHRMLGFPKDFSTPIFACSRVAGWTAHILEQYDNNRLMRPRAEYVGPREMRYIPIEQRDII